MGISKFWRFSDLREIGVVRNRVTLRRWIEKEGFPAGLLLGPNTRVWPNDQVEAWIAGRPERREDPPPENEKPAPLLQEGSRRVVEEDRHPSDNRIGSDRQASDEEAA
jgi:hypothetical protein